MKLSEAIRLGSMMKPQAFGVVIDGSGSCALMAAADAIGIGREYGVIGYQDLYNAFPVLHIKAVCPVWFCVHQGSTTDLMHVVWHSNDALRWTREEIADFVETFEAKEITECTDGTGLGPTDSFPVTHL